MFRNTILTQSQTKYCVQFERAIQLQV